jgi:hypothetical protein
MRRVLWAIQSFEPIKRTRQGFVQRWFTPSKSDGGAPIPQPAPLPTAPSMDTGAAGEMVAAKRRKLSKTLLTGPEGLDPNFDTSKKTLLGA